MMNRRFFIKFAANNIKKNGKSYIPYILTCIFTVAMFYIIKSLSLNPALETMIGADTLSYIMHLGSIVAALFALVFLFYANSFLIKRRKKELGIFHILGMEKRHLAKMLAWEILYVSFISLLGGLVLGAALDKVMFLLIVKMIDGKIALGFFVSSEAIMTTLILFAAIFLLIYLYSVHQIHTANPIELLQGGNLGEKAPRTNWPFAILGVLFAGTGYLISITTEKPLSKAAPYLFCAVILVIVGTYMLFTASSIALLKILRKKKNYYYKTKHFISISNMLYRMKQNAVGLANICILSTMVIVMVSSTSSLIFGMDDIIKTQYPNDFNVYSEEADWKHTEEAIACIHQLQQEQDLNVTAETGYTYLMLAVTVDGNHFYPVPSDTTTGKNNEANLVFVLLSDYNEIMNTDKTLHTNEIMVYSNRKDFYDETLNVFDKMYAVKETLDKAMGNGIIAENEANSYMIVVSGMNEINSLHDLQKMEFGELASDICCFYGFDTDMDETKQEDFYNLLIDTFAKFEYQGIVELKADARAEQIGIYGGFFFVGVFLGTLFIMAMILIIYYKQISEGYDDKERFAIMQKVGMSRQEIQSAIRPQVQTVFFLPLIVAGIHVAAAFPMVSRILVRLNLGNTELYITCTAACYLVFAILYLVTYHLTAKTYYKIISK